MFVWPIPFVAPAQCHPLVVPMIQDDPINKLLHNKTTPSQGYYPLNLDSEEEIALKGIDVTADKEKVAGKAEHKGVYYKYAMLIGLCKHRSDS